MTTHPAVLCSIVLALCLCGIVLAIYWGVTRASQVYADLLAGLDKLSGARPKSCSSRRNS